MSVWSWGLRAGEDFFKTGGGRRALGRAGEYGIKGLGLAVAGGASIAGIGLGAKYGLKSLGTGLQVGLDRTGTGIGKATGNILAGTTAGVAQAAENTKSAATDLVKPAILVGGGFLIYKLIAGAAK